MTLLCKTYLFCSPSTVQVLSVQTADPCRFVRLELFALRAEYDYCRTKRRKRMPPAALNLLSGKFAVCRPLSARTGTGATVSDGLETVEIGKGIIRREGEKIAIIAFGSMVAPSLTAADKLNATVADMRFVKPIDEELIVRLARSHDYIVTAEENAEQGGAGSAVLEVLAKHGICKPVLLLGVEDKVTEHGDPKNCWTTWVECRSD